MTREKRIHIDDKVARLLILSVFLFAVMAVTKGSQILKPTIFQTIARQVSEVGLMALGCGICMISGGIDLSGAYIANLAGITAGLIMQQTNGNIFAGLVCGILVGGLCGLFNGFLVSYLRIPAMLATLGSYQIFQGIGIVLSDGKTVQGSKVLANIGMIKVAGIPLPFIIFLIVAVAVIFLLSKTSYGRRVYFVGTNEKCSIFSGIRTKRVLLYTYSISGLLCGIAGILSLARINSAKADFGTSYTTQCILISVLGGIDPNGGFGAVPGVIIAALILQLLSAYLNTFPDTSNYYRDLIWGLALIGVLIANYYFDKHKSAKASK
jgi:simple sugar transport system permease protein